MASWCYIMYPSFGTKKTDTIYCKHYQPDLREKYDIVFSVKGNPSVKEWDTENVDNDF